MTKEDGHLEVRHALHEDVQLAADDDDNCCTRAKVMLRAVPLQLWHGEGAWLIGGFLLVLTTLALTMTEVRTERDAANRVVAIVHEQQRDLLRTVQETRRKVVQLREQASRRALSEPIAPLCEGARPPRRSDPRE